MISLSVPLNCVWGFVARPFPVRILRAEKRSTDEYMCINYGGTGGTWTERAACRVSRTVVARKGRSGPVGHVGAAF
jgi:hypothetical protein